MEHGLGVCCKYSYQQNAGVLILVLMEHGLGGRRLANWLLTVLILVLMEHGLGERRCYVWYRLCVLILVLMEHGLGDGVHEVPANVSIVLILVLMEHGLGEDGTTSRKSENECLNPCSNGTWSRRLAQTTLAHLYDVLILVLMEHGLGVITMFAHSSRRTSLNPCSNGTWSRRHTASYVFALSLS